MKYYIESRSEYKYIRGDSMHTHREFEDFSFLLFHFLFFRGGNKRKQKKRHPIHLSCCWLLPWVTPLSICCSSFFFFYPPAPLSFFPASPGSAGFLLSPGHTHRRRGGGGGFGRPLKIISRPSTIFPFLTIKKKKIVLCTYPQGPAGNPKLR